MKLTNYIIFFLLIACATPHSNQNKPSTTYIQVVDVLRKQIMEEADWALRQEPTTVTDQTSPRSAGDKHDFFSEGDYWWPNPASPDSPYVQRDGMTNPETLASLAMIRFSKIVGAGPASKLTGEKKYFQQL
jgi:hypothetical protein